MRSSTARMVARIIVEAVQDYHNQRPEVARELLQAALSIMASENEEICEQSEELARFLLQACPRRRAPFILQSLPTA